MSVTTAETIRPFTIPTASRAELNDLRARIENTRWPDREPVPDQSQGVQLEVMQELARYWAGPYDWRKCEARLQALPHFMTEIDGLDIHFIHVRSNHPHALPVIITHGWPGSIIELLRVIDLDAKNVSIPAAVTVFPNEIYKAPRSWTERAYPNLVYFNEVDRGGHFAAWQEPELFSAEVRTGFRSLR